MLVSVCIQALSNKSIHDQVKLVWSNARKSYAVVDSPWSLPPNVVSKELREAVWKELTPVSCGIPRCREEILASQLSSLRRFRQACIAHLEPSLLAFRGSRGFEHVARRILHLTPIQTPDLEVQMTHPNKIDVKNALTELLDAVPQEKEMRAIDRSNEAGGSKVSIMQFGEGSIDSREGSNEKNVNFRPLPLGRRMLIYKPMPWTLRQPKNTNAVELSRKVNKQDRHKPKTGNIVGKEVWATLQIGKNQIGRHGNCEVVLHTDQRCSRVHGIVCGRVRLPRN